MSTCLCRHSVPGSVEIYLVQSRNNQQQLLGFQNMLGLPPFLFLFCLGGHFSKGAQKIVR